MALWRVLEKTSGSAAPRRSGTRHNNNGIRRNSKAHGHGRSPLNRLAEKEGFVPRRKPKGKRNLTLMRLRVERHGLLILPMATHRFYPCQSLALNICLCLCRRGNLMLTARFTYFAYNNMLFLPLSAFLHKLLMQRSPAAQARYVISSSRMRSETTAPQKKKKKKGCRFCNLFLLRPHASSRFGGALVT